MIVANINQLTEYEQYLQISLEQEQVCMDCGE